MERDLEPTHKELLEQTLHKVLDERARSGRDSGELTVKGPFGFILSGRGRTVVAVIIIVAVLFGVYLHDEKMDRANAALSAKSEAIANAQRETTFVLTLSEAERARLNLQIPDTLRARMQTGTFRP